MRFSSANGRFARASSISERVAFFIKSNNVDTVPSNYRFNIDPPSPVTILLE